jgi:hypothetical protein
MQYVERCQSFLQWGQPDNDFLVLVPVRDAWKKNPGRLLMQFSIHAMGQLMPEFRQAILDIDRAGFDCDYISERLLMNTRCEGGRLVTEGGTSYRGLIIPGSGEMADKVKQHVERLKAQGAHVMYGIDAQQMAETAKSEPMKTRLGLKAIRRKNATGYHYFIANLTSEDIHQRVPLAVAFKDAKWFNPLNGEISDVAFDGNGVDICLRSGESMILQTFDKPVTAIEKAETTSIDKRSNVEGRQISLDGPWTLSFVEEAPKVGKTYQLAHLQSWEGLDEQTKVTMGTGVYTTHVKMSKKDRPESHWLIDLGDVRESARVYINGTFVGCAWSVPFVLDTKGALRVGDNEVRIEVTNLPANRISDLDRKGVKWRKMEEINVVDINYRKTTYDQWEPMPSGLNSAVKLIMK